MQKFQWSIFSNSGGLARKPVPSDKTEDLTLGMVKETYQPQ